MVIVVALVSLVLIWVVSVHIAWLINRSEIKRTYGHAPYNWRVLGYMYSYIPYVKSLEHDE